MSTPAVTPQIDSTDPRVQQVLALIRAKSGQAPVAPTDTPSVGTVPSPIAQAAMTPPPPDAGPPPPTPNVAPMPGAPPQLAPPASPNIQPQPGPVKSFLQQLVSGLGGAAYQGTQGALQKLGIPTDYEKQQNALKIGLQQQAQNSLESYRTAEGNRQDALTAATQSGLADYKIPQDAIYGPLAGQTLPRSVAVPLMEKMAALANAKDIAAGKNTTTLAGKEIQFGPDSYMRKGVRSIGGRIEMYDKSNGQKLVDMGPDTSLQTAFARGEGYAKGRAMYTPFTTTDANGAPTVISNLQAIQSGAPRQSFTEARNLTSDLVGVKQYQDILDQKISPNLTVLNDPTQRAVIAHTLAEGKDASPGALQALITSGLQEGVLSPQGAALAAGILQAREFGSVARKYGGNMNGTEGLMDRIIGNQASPLNAEQLNRDLIQNDRAFTSRALGSITNLMSNTKRTAVKGGAPSTPAVNPTTGHPDFFHPLTPTKP